MSIKVLSAVNLGGYVLPTQDGLLGQILTTDGSGVVSFQNPAPTNNFYLTGLSFNTSSGLLTATVTGSSNVTVNLDGRYALTGHVHPYDNYQFWNLRTNGVQRTTIQSGGILDLTAGSSISLAYSAGGVVTVASTDTLASVTGRGNTTTNSINVGAGVFSGSVTASSLIRSGGTSTQYLMANGSVSTLTNPITGTGTTGQVSFFNGTTTQTGDNGLFWNNSTKRLGIGSTNPSERLTVVGNIFVDGTSAGTGNVDVDSLFGAFRLNGPGGFRGGLFNDQNLTGNVANSLDDLTTYVSDGSYHIALGGGTQQYNNKILTVSGSSVGIGTTNPSEKLHVSGRVRITTVDNGTGDFATISGTGVITRRTPTQVLSDIGAQAAITNAITGTGTTNFLSKFTGTSTLGNSLLFDNGTNVGIGTTSPSKTLHIAAPAATAPTIRLQTTNSTINGQIQWANSANALLAFIGANANISDGSGNLEFATGGSSTRMVINSTGNVGIGTTAPDGLLEIESASNAGATLYISGGTNNDADIRFRQQGTDRWLAGYDDSPDGFRFYDYQGAAGVRMFIESSTGNVGIGTTSPTHKLHVLNAAAVAVIGDGNDNYFGNYSSGDYWDIGNLGATGNVYLESRGASTNINNQYRAKGAGSHIWTYNGGANEIMRTTSSGNVGIGTTSPGAKLDVRGDINVTNANISNYDLTVPPGTTTVASVPAAIYSSVAIDYVVKNGLNLRSGTIVACHDGTSTVFTETSTPDIGSTTDITFNVSVLGADLVLQSTVTLPGWEVKTLVRAL